MDINMLLNKIKEKKYKVTEQRRAILQVLISNIDNLISVENLFEQSKQIYNKTNMSTVYRNLEVFENLNLVYKNVTENGNTVYKLICSDKHHHHIICKKCGKTEIIEFCPINIFEKMSKEKNYILTDHKLELYGYCLSCQSPKHCNDID